MPQKSAYELVKGANYYMLRGGVLNDAQKGKIVGALLAGRQRPGGYVHESKKGYAYPKFFIPPYNGGKKMQTLVPMSPKTYMVADNAYEFEILRLLKLFAPQGDAEYRDDWHHMAGITRERLKKTCFGYEKCHYAECFEAGLTVLRFLSFGAAGDDAWVQQQIAVYNAHYADRKRHGGVARYYWLCLSELPLALAAPEIEKQKDAILTQLRRTYPNKTGDEDIPLLVMRNALARLPGYEGLLTQTPKLDEKTGRWGFISADTARLTGTRGYTVEQFKENMQQAIKQGVNKNE